MFDDHEVGMGTWRGLPSAHHFIQWADRTLRGLLVYTAIGSISRWNVDFNPSHRGYIPQSRCTMQVQAGVGFALIQFTQDSHQKVLKSEVWVRKVSFTSKMYYGLSSTYTQFQIYFVCTAGIFLRILDWCSLILYICLMLRILFLQNYMFLSLFFSLLDVSTETDNSHPRKQTHTTFLCIASLCLLYSSRMHWNGCLKCVQLLEHSLCDTS